MDKGISEIIKDKIYLGDIFTAKNASKLELYGIQSILNLSDFDVEPPKSIQQYKVLHIKDDIHEHISDYFEECNNFIKEAPKPIYIHCNCGVSRSATILIAYFISQNMSFQQAYNAVFNKRRFIKPNRMFFKQLFHYALETCEDPMMAYNFIANFWECDGKKENMIKEDKIAFAIDMDNHDFTIGHLGLQSLDYYDPQYS